MNENKSQRDHLIINVDELHIVDLELCVETFQVETSYGDSDKTRCVSVNVNKLKFLDDLNKSYRVVFQIKYKTERRTVTEYINVDKLDFGFEDNLKLENVNKNVHNFLNLKEINIHDKEIESSFILFINNQLTGFNNIQEHVKHIFNKGKDCGMFKYLQRCMFLTFKQPITDENKSEWRTVLLDSIKMNKKHLLLYYYNINTKLNIIDNSFNSDIVGNVVDYIDEQTFDGKYEISIDQAFKAIDL